MGSVNKFSEDGTASAREVDEDSPMAEKGRTEGVDSGDEEAEVPVLTDLGDIARIMLPVLLAARDGLGVLRLAQVMNCTQKQVLAAVDRVQKDLAAFSLEVRREGDRIRVLTFPDVHPYLSRLRGAKKQERLSPAALETLAVIAYRQPVIRAEIEAIRGVKAGPVLRTLLDHKLIKVMGRADVPGRPLQYGTSQHFLERFGLESIQDLPSIREFKGLG